MRARTRAAVLAIFCVGGAFTARVTAASTQAFSLDDVVNQALAVNAQVLSAKDQYQAALHQVDQAYAPQDPQLSLTLTSTPNGLDQAQARTLQISESFQFPGVSWLQGSAARRGAEIAKLAYQAAARDARAQAQIQFYQTLLDSASAQIALENAQSLAEVLAVAQAAYAANQAAQTDLISAQFAVFAASQAVWTAQAAQANDEAALDQTIGRDPREPMELDGGLEIAPLKATPAQETARALASRQELLEAMLTEKNAKTALRLAWMELLPSLTASWAWNDYPPGSTSSIKPQGPYHDYSTSLAFNVPVFFWFHQRQDALAAQRLLDAARANHRAAELQTLAAVTQLDRSARLAYKTALLYRDQMAPLAKQNFRVALIAYQSQKIDFTTLSSILQNLYSARMAYLTAANQFLAGKIALEQAMGGPQ